MAHFNPTTERQRIYAALIDHEHAAQYLTGVTFDDLECSLVARAVLGATEGGRDLATIIKTLLDAVPMMRDMLQVSAVVAITKPNAAWWRELFEECRDMEQSP